MQRGAWRAFWLSGALMNAASKYFTKGSTFWYEGMAALT
jgi:hypothetical protein